MNERVVSRARRKTRSRSRRPIAHAFEVFTAA